MCYVGFHPYTNPETQFVKMRFGGKLSIHTPLDYSSDHLSTRCAPWLSQQNIKSLIRSKTLVAAHYCNTRGGEARVIALLLLLQLASFFTIDLETCLNLDDGLFLCIWCFWSVALCMFLCTQSSQSVLLEKELREVSMWGCNWYASDRYLYNNVSESCMSFTMLNRLCWRTLRTLAHCALLGYAPSLSVPPSKIVLAHMCSPNHQWGPLWVVVPHTIYIIFVDMSHCHPMATSNSSAFNVPNRVPSLSTLFCTFRFLIECSSKLVPFPHIDITTVVFFPTALSNTKFKGVPL